MFLFSLHSINESHLFEITLLHLNNPHSDCEVCLMTFLSVMIPHVPHLSALISVLMMVLVLYGLCLFVHLLTMFSTFNFLQKLFPQLILWSWRWRVPYVNQKCTIGLQLGWDLLETVKNIACNLYYFHSSVHPWALVSGELGDYHSRRNHSYQDKSVSLLYGDQMMIRHGSVYDEPTVD